VTGSEERSIIVAYLRECARVVSKMGDEFGAPGDSERLHCKLQESTLLTYAEGIEREEHLEWQKKIGAHLMATERHDWRCDCEWCWLGVTNTPQPPSLFKRVWARVKSRIAMEKE
jgi:hypothetical protein